MSANKIGPGLLIYKKNLGFANFTRLGRVHKPKIMSKGAGFTNISVHSVSVRVGLCITLRKIAHLAKGLQKRARGCSVNVPNLSSCTYVKKGESQCTNDKNMCNDVVDVAQKGTVFKVNAEKNVVVHTRGHKVEQFVNKRQGQGCEVQAPVNSTPKICYANSKCFYNSSLNRKTWEGLLARGNKRKQLASFPKNQPIYSRMYLNTTIQNKVANNSLLVRSDKKPIVSKVGESMLEQCKNQSFDTSNILEVDNNSAIPDSIDSCSHPCHVDNNPSNNECPINKVTPQNTSDSVHTVKVFDIKNHIADDKFITAMLNKDGWRSQIPWLTKNCVAFCKWRKQTDYDFGFVPLLPNEKFVDFSGPQCPIQQHIAVKARGCPNFMGARIPVQSELNINEWQKVLAEYWDKQLIELLKFGFPLDFNRQCPLTSDGKNHASAVDHPNDVLAYIQEEVNHNAILGPFHTDPIPKMHFSPFMTREKPNSDTRRVIIDLSWPKGNSVNSGIDKNSYLGSEFALTFPTVDNITEDLRKVGPGAPIFKIDISRAFSTLNWIQLIMTSWAFIGTPRILIHACRLARRTEARFFSASATQYATS